MAATTWARERQCGGQSDVKHCHLLFHLPAEYRAGSRAGQGCGPSSCETPRSRLTHDRVIALTVWPSPDGKYLIKGGPKGLEKVSRSQRALPPAGYYPRQALRRDRKHWGGCAKGGKRKKGHNQPIKVIHSWPLSPKWPRSPARSSLGFGVRPLWLTEPRFQVPPARSKYDSQ